MIDVRDISITYQPADEAAPAPVCTASFHWKSSSLFRYICARIHRDTEKNPKVEVRVRTSKQDLPQLVFEQYDEDYRHDMQVILTFYKGTSVEDLSELRKAF
jgi:hypothetical protein